LTASQKVQLSRPDGITLHPRPVKSSLREAAEPI